MIRPATKCRLVAKPLSTRSIFMSCRCQEKFSGACAVGGTTSSSRVLNSVCRKAFPSPRCLSGKSGVQLCSEKYFTSLRAKITSMDHPSRPVRGAARDRHGRGAGCDGCDGVKRRMMPDCIRRSRVVLTPRRWRQVGEDACRVSLIMVARKPGHQGEPEVSR
jgi:hypothetical protein